MTDDQTPLKQMLNYEFQRVDSVDLDAVQKLDDAAVDGNFKHLRSISDDYLRSLSLRYGHMAPQFKWARAMIHEQSERRESRARRERWLFAILSIVFGGISGAVVSWLLRANVPHY